MLVTPSVKEALLLENELIKQHKPPFNVRLRDDKQYLGLRLDPRESWPRLRMVRRFARDGALYFGPYTSSAAMHESLSQLRRIFPLRSCSDPVFQDYARRGRPCIEYEMKRCPAPCVGLGHARGLRELLAGTELFLRGRSDELVSTSCASAWRRPPPRSASRRRRGCATASRAVEQTVQRQQIVSDRLVERDVFGLARRGGEVEVQVLHVREGRMIGARTTPSPTWSSTTRTCWPRSSASTTRATPSARCPPRCSPRPSRPTTARSRRCSPSAPARGARARAAARPGGELVELARENAELALARRIEARESVDAAAAELQERLGLAALPRRIECYDVSNLAGHARRRQPRGVRGRAAEQGGLPPLSHARGRGRRRLRLPARGAARAGSRSARASRCPTC